MRHSLDTAAHVTTVIEVDMTGVVNLRKKWKPEYQQRYGVNLTYIPFIARATIDAIGSWPWVNAEVRGESALGGPAGSTSQEAGLDQIIGHDPTPEFAAQMAEECQRLLEGAAI